MQVAPIVTLRLEGVKGSCERSRLAFFIAVVSAMCIWIVLYNDHLSFSNYWFDATPDQYAGKNRPNPEASTLEHQEVLKNAEANTNISFLGVRLGDADLTFFGSLAMGVVSIYYCLCCRRTRNDITSLLQYARTADSETQEYILAGIRQSLVFTAASNETSLFANTPEIPTGRVVLRYISKIFSWLTYAPSIAIFAIILGDLKFFLRDHLSSLPLLSEKVQFLFLDGLAIAFLFVVWNFDRLTNRFQDATANELSSFLRDRPMSFDGHLISTTLTETAKPAKATGG